jgi:putative RNA 2'-phosphotransferase
MLRQCEEHGYFRGESCLECQESGKFLMNQDELDKLGRMMAGILRHFPEKFNLEIDEEGWVDLIAFINAIRRRQSTFHWLRQHHIQAVVDTDPKERYQIEDNLIRATYGHSLNVEPDLPTENIPDLLYYPTTDEEAELLLETGLKPADRKKVHLSKTVEDAVIAGKVRVDVPIILEINAKDAIENGAIIKKAGKTVYTTQKIEPNFLQILKSPDL